ncbi:MAG: molybdate transporter permease [Sphingomonas bacterium]|nr:molybdate transporter permease [Sphingomonas bacterium]
MLLSAEEWGIVLLSLKVGVTATILLLPVAWGLAYLLARRAFPGKVLLDAAVHLPLVLPPVVVGYALLLLFAPAGPFGPAVAWLTGGSLLFAWQGAALAAAVMALPLAVRAIRLGIEAIDPEVEEVARLLGASRAQRIRRIVLPLSRPGISAAAVLAFARALGEFGATITFVASVPGATMTLPLAIHAALQRPGGEAMVLRLSLLSIALSFAALIGSEVIARRGRARGLD